LSDLAIATADANVCIVEYVEQFTEPLDAVEQRKADRFALPLAQICILLGEHCKRRAEEEFCAQRAVAELVAEADETHERAEHSDAVAVCSAQRPVDGHRVRRLCLKWIQLLFVAFDGRSQEVALELWKQTLGELCDDLRVEILRASRKGACQLVVEEAEGQMCGEATCARHVVDPQRLGAVCHPRTSAADECDGTDGADLLELEV